MNGTNRDGGHWKRLGKSSQQQSAEDRKPILVQVPPPSSTVLSQAPTITTPAMDTINKIICKQERLLKQEQPSTTCIIDNIVPTQTTVAGEKPMETVTSVSSGLMAAAPASSLAVTSQQLANFLSSGSCLSLTNLLGMPSPQLGTLQGGLALAPSTSVTAAVTSSPSGAAANANPNVAVVYAWPQPNSIANGVAQLITSVVGTAQDLAAPADVKPQVNHLVAPPAPSHSPVQSPLDASSASETYSQPATPIMSPAPESPESHQGEPQPQSAGGGKMRARRVLSGGKDEKICGVCSDKALGCNFDAISCESCKAFFRRNALKDKQTKCLFEGNCQMNINTRRFCPHCRLKKCLAIGMKRELILCDDDKKKRTAKVENNRQKRQNTNIVMQTVEQVFQAAVGQVATPGEGTSRATEPPVVVAVPASAAVGGEVVAEPMPDTSNLLMISKYMRLSESTIPSHLDTYLLRRLTEEENRMISELVQVYDLSFTVDLEPLIHIKALDPSLNQLVNQSSITVLRLIKFAKRLEDFVRLPQECQIGILKGTWIHILLLRSVALYDTERDVWVTPRGDIPTEILKNATGFVQLHDDHVCYCKNIKQIIRDDLTIVVVLLVIVLFSPEGPHVLTREVVSNLQDKYLLLLKHYLESKYTYTRAADMFPQLMSKMKELKELAEVHGKYLLDVNPREIEPIMLEILDLK